MLSELDELDVRLLRDAARGVPLYETAAALSYSYQWAKMKRSELLRRLEVRTMTEALARALDLGLLTEEVVNNVGNSE